MESQGVGAQKNGVSYKLSATTKDAAVVERKENGISEMYIITKDTDTKAIITSDPSQNVIQHAKESWYNHSDINGIEIEAIKCAAMLKNILEESGANEEVLKRVNTYIDNLICIAEAKKCK